MPEFSNYVESLDTAADATGTILIPVSRNGDAEKMTPEQIVEAGGASGGGGTWGSITGTLSSQTDLNTALGLKAPLASPTFTGTPAAPTAAGGTNTTQVATTAFVQSAVANSKTLVIACSDEVTPITATTGKVTFRMPFAMTLSGVRASLTTEQTSGSIFTVDINEGPSSILSTKLTIDNGQKTSTTATTPAVISDSSLADDAEITIDVDQIGDTTAKGLKVTLIGS